MISNETIEKNDNIDLKRKLNFRKFLSKISCYRNVYNIIPTFKQHIDID